MQIKATMKYDYIPTRMSKIEKTNKHQIVTGYEAIETLVYCCCECKMT